jgi:hypothetical protein
MAHRSIRWVCILARDADQSYIYDIYSSSSRIIRPAGVTSAPHGIDMLGFLADMPYENCEALDVQSGTALLLVYSALHGEKIAKPTC